MHARAVGVEDARDLDLQPMLAVVVEEQGLGAALAFVIAGARADGIDVAPIALALRMDERVAIDLGGGGLQDARMHPLGEAQHVDGAMHAGLGGLHRIVLIVDGRSRAGEIVDAAHLQIEREADVVADGLEARVVEDGHEVAARAGEIIVDADDVVSVGEEPRAKMRPQKPAPPVTSTVMQSLLCARHSTSRAGDRCRLFFSNRRVG